MKKMRVSKRGFTLTEIIIVVAIMVIVASAAFVGVAVVLENAKNNADDVNAKHGRDEDGKELFEADAWDEIDALTKDAARFFDVSLYKPSNPTNTPTPTPSPTPADNPGGATSTPTTQATATPTTQATATPTPTTASSATSTPQATPTSKPASTVSGGNGISVNSSNIVPEYQGKRGVIKCEKDSSNANKTNLYITDIKGDNKNLMVITKNGDNYSIDLGYQQWVLNDGGYPGGVQNGQTLTQQQKDWLTEKYGINFT